MKNRLTFLMLSSVFGLLLMFFSGCYTQLGSLRNEREDDGQYTTSDQQQGEENNENDSEGYSYNSNCCGNDYRPHVGFSYYYPSYYWPSYAFSMAYADPWFYDYAWGYNPGYYYSPYVWNPYYRYYPYYNGYYYGYDGAYSNYGRRYDGSMRGGGRDGGTTGTVYEPRNPAGTDFNLPTGVRLGGASGGATPTKNLPVVRDTRRSTGNDRGTAPRNDRVSQRRIDTNVHGQGTRNNNTRVHRRDTQPQQRPQETNNPPPTHQTPPREDRGSTPSYTPPPASPPRQSSPPPSNDGGRRSDGGNRSGGRKP